MSDIHPPDQLCCIATAPASCRSYDFVKSAYCHAAAAITLRAPLQAEQGMNGAAITKAWCALLDANASAPHYIQAAPGSLRLRRGLESSRAGSIEGRDNPPLHAYRSRRIWRASIRSPRSAIEFKECRETTLPSHAQPWDCQITSPPLGEQRRGHQRSDGPGRSPRLAIVAKSRIC